MCVSIVGQYSIACMQGARYYSAAISQLGTIILLGGGVGVHAAIGRFLGGGEWVVGTEGGGSAEGVHLSSCMLTRIHITMWVCGRVCVCGKYRSREPLQASALLTPPVLCTWLCFKHRAVTTYYA